MTSARLDSASHAFSPPVPILSSPGGLRRFPCGSGYTRFIVADTGHHQIAVVGEEGSVINRFGSGEAGFRDGPVGEARFCSPRAVACTCEAIYVADSGALRKIDLAGNRVTTLAAGAVVSGVLDLEVLGERLIFIQQETPQVWACSLATGEVALLAELGPNASPGALALAPLAGKLYVADGENAALWVLDLQSGRVERMGEVGTGAWSGLRFGRLCGLAVAGARLYVAEAGTNTPLRMLDLEQGRVEVLTGAGWRGPEGEPPLESPVGLLSHGPEQLLVTEPARHRLLLLDLTHRRVARLV